MLKPNIEFQYMLALSSGLFFGMFSSGLFLILLYLSFFECLIFCWSVYETMSEFVLERVFINLMFLLGWTLARALYLRESGFEPFSHSIEKCYN